MVTATHDLKNWCMHDVIGLEHGTCVEHVGFCFSGYYHYTSAGIVVITAKTKSNIKEAKATSSTPVSKLSAPSTGSEVALSAVSLMNYTLSGITPLGFTTSAGFEP